MAAVNEAPKAPYRADIDGIRAIAVLSVVLYHAGATVIPGGFTGVDIFFVISGYLIGGHIFADIRGGRFSFARFYQRRMQRILPAFYSVLSLTFVVGLFWLSPVEFVAYSKSAIAAVLSASNVYFLRGSSYFQGSSELSPLLMTWSLGVEEQFYFVIPLLMFATAKIRRGLLLPVILMICALSFLYAWHQVHVAPDQAFYLLDSRAWELGVGVAWAIAEAMRNRTIVPSRWAAPVSFAGVVAMLAPVIFLKPTMQFPGPSAALSVLGTALVIGCPSSWINRRILSFPWLVFVGRVSYSWYLFHWPLMAFLRLASGGPLPPSAGLFAVVISFVLAVLSYYYIEQTSRKLSLTPMPMFVRCASGGLALVAVFALAWKTHGLPARFPEMHQEQVAHSANCLVDYGRSAPDVSASCYGLSDGSPAIVLWGDSHSAALAPAIRAEAASDHYQFIEFSKSSCLPLLGVAKFVPEHPSVVEECVKFNEIVSKIILADPKIRTVILAGRWADPFVAGNAEPLVDVTLARERRKPPATAVSKLFLDALSKNIAALESGGKHVVLVNDVPNFDFDPLCSLRSEQIPLRRLTASWMAQGNSTPGLARAAFVEAAERSGEALETIHSRFPNVDLLSLSSRLCDGNGMCAYIHGGKLLYSDGQHLTADGAFYVLKGLSFSGLWDLDSRIKVPIGAGGNHE